MALYNQGKEIVAFREELADVLHQRAEAHAEFSRLENVLFEVLEKCGIDDCRECIVAAGGRDNDDAMLLGRTPFVVTAVGLVDRHWTNHHISSLQCQCLSRVSICNASHAWSVRRWTVSSADATI